MTVHQHMREGNLLNPKKYAVADEECIEAIYICFDQARRMLLSSLAQGLRNSELLNKIDEQHQSQLVRLV